MTEKFSLLLLVNEMEVVHGAWISARQIGQRGKTRNAFHVEIVRRPSTIER